MRVEMLKKSQKEEGLLVLYSHWGRRREHFRRFSVSYYKK